MRPSWISDSYRSYLGDPVYHTPGARLNEAVRWYRTLTNLGFEQTPELVRLTRFIRHGVLSSAEASQVFYDRLPKKKKSRYSLMIYWIEDGWMSEEYFYFKFVDWSCFVDPVAVSTALFQ